MKKSLILSSVVAIAVVGMLSLSGCGGNSGSKTNNKVVPGASDKGSVNKDGTRISITQKDNKGKEINKVDLTMRNVSKNSKNKGCEDEKKSYDECPAEQQKGCDVLANDDNLANDCGVTVQRACTSGEKLDYKTASQEGMAIRAKAGLNPSGADRTIRYNGLLSVFTDDDINEGTLYLKVDLDCALGDAQIDSNNDGVSDDGIYYYNSHVYVNGYTTPVGSKVYAVVVDKDGNVVGTKEGVVKYHDDAKKHAYVDFEKNNGIDIGDLGKDELKVYFYTDAVLLVDGNDLDKPGTPTGATGSTGATGAGS